MFEYYCCCGCDPRASEKCTIVYAVENKCERKSVRKMREQKCSLEVTWIPSELRPKFVIVYVMLRECFCSRRRYGQLSGMVEPVAGILGALLVVMATPILPYALSFAAGAMIYVVVDDIIPEANTRYEIREHFLIRRINFSSFTR